MMELRINCLWLPPSHGGRRFDPHPGLRLGIRWQQHVQDDRDIYRDVQFEELGFDPATRQGVAAIRLMSDVPSDWVRHGELLEILEGFKVVAVGYVIDEGRS
jgi:hypothetical protein